MKLKTSFCEPTVIKKNLTRFSPAWVLYGVYWLLILIIMLDSEGTGKWFADSMAESLQFTAIFNMGYAFLCAQLLFGDLYNSRMCNALHAMPLRRECWFFTHVISGLLFSLIPNVLTMLLSSIFMEAAFLVAPLWLLVNTLQFLFFFGVAALSAYCVGNRFAMALVYIIINGFSMIAYWLVESLYAPQLYGIRIDDTPFTWFCPVFYMVSEPAVNLEFPGVSQQTSIPVIELGTGFWYTLLSAGVGLVFMALALLLYRKRNLECAGDFMAVKVLSPVFLILYCLCGGAVGYLFFSLFVGEDSLLFLLVGMVIGWFTGRMLLERTVRVFRMKSFVGCGILLLAFFGSLLLTWLDPLGITRWVPNAQQVNAVHLVTGGSRYDYYKEGANRLTAQEDIEVALALHRYGIQNRDANYNGKQDITITIDYELKSGRTVSRYYTVDIPTAESDALEAILSRADIVFGCEVTDAKTLADSLVLIRTGDDDTVLTGEAMVPLLEAILKDCAEGTMAQDWAFHPQEDVVVWLTMQMKSDTDYHQYRDVRVYPTSKHTYNYLVENDLIGNQDKYK